ncbi:MAG: hypothetical protein KBC02_01430 [Candidatus Pacebacteria bacterium]|nr:hypothetical protein [Candidatus Paceibacterota bacterium]
MFFEKVSDPVTALYLFIAMVAILWTGAGLFIQEILKESKHRVRTLAWSAVYLGWWLGFTTMVSIMAGPINGSSLASFGEAAILMQIGLAVVGFITAVMITTCVALAEVTRVLNQQFSRGAQR